MSEVLIYSQDSCPYCTELKGLLDTNGIPYRVKDIDKHEKEWDSISKHSGVDYVPTVLLLDKGNGVGNVLAPDRDFDELEECLQLIQTHLQE
jgi:glutaredoxin 3|tara:strand:- start:121 stop:396 length:276 start_codon:yes stop_codon:yes gene_type:complete